MGVQAHHAAAVPDGPELLVGEVSGDAAQGAAVGVGGDHRAAGQLQDLPKAGVVQVGDVDEHPQVLHPAECLPAQRGEALPGVLGGAGGEAVVLVPGQHPHPDAQGRQAVQRLQPLPHGLHALDGQEGVELPLRPGGLRLPGRADHRQPGALGELRLGAGEHDLQPRPGVLPAGDALPEGLPLSPAVPQGQDQPLDPAPAEAGQVAPLQHMVLAQEAAAGHVVKQVGMSVENHSHAPFVLSPVYSETAGPSRGHPSGPGEGGGPSPRGLRFFSENLVYPLCKRGKIR